MLSPPHLYPNARAFAKPKSSDKGALIIDMRTINSRCVDSTPRFRLPTLEHLKHALSRSSSQAIFFCKLDISNHFWSCKLPPAAQHKIRVGINGTLYSLTSLPFGWKCSPVIAQLLLGAYLAPLHHSHVVTLQYLDDILLFSTDREALHSFTSLMVRSLSSAGWILSQKSSTTPSPTIQWMGKDLDGSRCTISNSGSYAASMVVQWLLLATSGCSATRLRRLLGKLNWAVRPTLGAHPFLSGAYLWLHRGPRFSHYTPARVLRGLAEALALSLYPWAAHPPAPPGPLWFTDASFDGTHFWCSLWHPSLGFRISRAPPWVLSQQSAELFAVVQAARVAVFRGLSSVSIATDNSAALYCALACKASPSATAHNRLLRQLQHLLRWSSLHLSLHWIRGSLNPADPSSRWYLYPDLSVMIGHTLGRHLAFSRDPLRFAPCCGSVTYRT